MKQQISEWVDGELDDDESDRIAAAARSDAQFRAAWDTYHLIGDALRGHVGRDITDEVASRLSREMTILAPRRHAGASVGRLGRWSLSAAAAIAAVAMVAWLALPTLRVAPQIAMTPAVPAAGTSPASTSAGSAPAVPAGGIEVANYLMAHHRYSSMGAIQGVVPYVRAVADVRQGDQ